MELDQKGKQAISLSLSLSLSHSKSQLAENCGIMRHILAANLEKQETIIKLFKIAENLYQQAIGS